MNGIFPADLAVYLVLAPIVVYIFYSHPWSGFLPWFYLSAFCLVRIIGGILGIHDSDGLPANIIQGVGLMHLILAVDGLVHEGYVVNLMPILSNGSYRLITSGRPDEYIATHRLVTCSAGRSFL
jgi:hypothetical protein